MLYLYGVRSGFLPLEPPKPRLDADGRFVGYEYTKQELLEVSCVPIGMNPEALARAGLAPVELGRIGHLIAGLVHAPAARRRGR